MKNNKDIIESSYFKKVLELIKSVLPVITFPDEAESLAMKICKLEQSPSREVVQGSQECPVCFGNGYTSEHNPADPHPDGECSGSCPIQVECERCNATGIVQSSQPEKTGAEEIAQWVIDNRYSKSENEKVSDFEMYQYILDAFNKFSSQPEAKEVDERPDVCRCNNPSMDRNGYYRECGGEIS
jgi:hypothetical protein